MAVLERIRCTKCGAEFEEIDDSSPFMRCTRIGCGATFVIRQAKEFAKAEIDHTSDIQNLRQLLAEAAEHNDLKAMEASTQNIRMWVPDDYFAGYCAALAQKKYGRVRVYTDFLQASHEMTPEERDQVFDIMLSHAHFTMHDEDAVNTYIHINYPTGQQEEKKRELRQAIDCLSEEQNLLAHIPRDVFICHSSSDDKIAMEAYEELTSDGNTCWISYKNLPPDTVDYWAEIRNAIQKCKIMLVISSNQCMLRRDPVREMEIAVEYGLKRLELKIDDSKHTAYFKYFFEGIQWVRRSGNREKTYKALRERVCRLLHDTGGSAAAKAVTGNEMGGAQKTAVEVQKNEKKNEAGTVKKAAEEKTSKQNADIYTAAPLLPVKLDKAVVVKPKKPKGTSVISKFRRRLGRFLSCILIFAWILLILLNYLGLYNVLDDWQREMPVLKSIYVSGWEIFLEYLKPADFLDNSNPVEFLALAGSMLILIILLPFGPLVIYRAAGKLAFWLLTLFTYNIFYYLNKNQVIKGAILQDKIVLMAGYLLHTAIALAVCMAVRAVFRKAAAKQAGK